MGKRIECMIKYINTMGGEMIMEHDKCTTYGVLCDAIDQLDKTYGCVMGGMDATKCDDATGTVDVMTIDNEIMHVTVTVQLADWD